MTRKRQTKQRGSFSERSQTVGRSRGGVSSLPSGGSDHTTPRKRSIKKTDAARKVVDLKTSETTARARQITGQKARVYDFGIRGIWLSVRQFCQESARAVDFVTKRIHESALRAEAGPKGEALYRLKDLLDVVVLRDADGQTNPEALDPFRRKAFFASQLDKLRLEQQSGELIPRMEVENEIAHVVKTVAQLFDTLPDVLERDCGLGGDALVVLERKLDGVREDLFQSLAQRTADDATTARESA